jgi:hydroxymethylpyrimidine/phosphomethylpyrimidine kinase
MNTPIEYFNGYRLVETTAITKQVQRKTHKKRRINKKWLKRYGYKTVLDDYKIVIFENSILATPKTIKKIIEQMKGGDS